MTVRMRENRWQPREGEIAGRVEIDLLKGRWFKEVIVEPGQGALFSAEGSHLPPQPNGSYLVQALGDRLAKLIGWANVQRMTATFYNRAPFDVPLRWDDGISADAYQLTVALRLNLQVADPEKLRNTLLFSRDVLTTADVTAQVLPLVQSTVNRWLRERRFADLPKPADRPAHLLTLAQSALEHELNENGLQISGVYGALIDAPHVQVMTAQTAELKAQQEQLEMSRRRSDLQRRIREDLLQRRTDELQSAQAFDELLRQLNREKLLADTQWERFVRDLQAQRAQESADAEFQRQQRALIVEYALKALDAELRFEEEQQALLRTAALTTQRHALENLRLQHQLELQRMRAAFEREQDELNTQLGLRLLDQLKRRRGSQPG